MKSSILFVLFVLFLLSARADEICREYESKALKEVKRLMDEGKVDGTCMDELKRIIPETDGDGEEAKDNVKDVCEDLIKMTKEKGTEETKPIFDCLKKVSNEAVTETGPIDENCKEYFRTHYYCEREDEEELKEE